MTPLAKFNSFVVTATTIIMYVLWLGIKKYVDVNSDWIVLITILTAATSLGFYRCVTNILKWLFQKFRFIKKIILGDSYLEGTWVGFFASNDGSIRYLYEIYEQDLDGIVISGHSFKMNKEFHGKWNVSMPCVDLKNRKITYCYEADMIKNLFINPGIASFTMKKSKGSKYYNKMQGFSSDLFYPGKLWAIEEKIKDEFLTDEHFILQMAEQIYQENKDFIPK